MNSKFLSTLSVAVVALIAATPLTQAKTYTPTQFNAELKKKVGTKKGAAAYNSMANFFGSVVKDKTNKKNTVKYINSMAKIMKDQKVIPIALQGKSVNTILSKFQTNYFVGLTYNINDATFNKGLTALIKTLAASQKSSQANSNMFYGTIKNYAVNKKKQSKQSVYNYYSAFAKKNNLKVPPTS